MQSNCTATSNLVYSNHFNYNSVPSPQYQNTIFLSLITLTFSDVCRLKLSFPQSQEIFRISFSFQNCLGGRTITTQRERNIFNSLFIFLVTLVITCGFLCWIIHGTRDTWASSVRSHDCVRYYKNYNRYVAKYIMSTFTHPNVGHAFVQTSVSIREALTRG